MSSAVPTTMSRHGTFDVWDKWRAAVATETASTSIFNTFMLINRDLCIKFENRVMSDLAERHCIEPLKYFALLFIEFDPILINNVTNRDLCIK